MGSHHPGCCPGPHGILTHQSHTSPGLCHQPCEPLPTHSSVPPLPKGGIDFKALEDRLDAAFTQKLENIAETLKASWTKPQQSPPGDSILISSSSAPGTPAFTSSTLDQLQQAGIGDASTPTPPKLPIKAKPPLPPKLAQSAQDPTATPRRRRSRSPQDILPSRGSRTRHRPAHRSRSPSHRTARGGYGEKGPRPRHSHTARSSRQGPPSRTFRPPSSSTRFFARPIYETSTTLRHSSPTTRSERSRPTYKDVPPTILINARESLAKTGTHHSRNRPDPPATLRLRSRSRENRTRQRNYRGLFERAPRFQIRAKARPVTPAAVSGTSQPEPEPPQTIDESLEMVLPASVDIPPSDWSRLSPELQEQGQDEEPILANRTLGPDRPTIWSRRPMKTAVEPKLLVSWSKLALCAWLKESAQKNMKASYIFYIPGIRLHHRRSLEIWLLFLPTLGR